MNYYQIGIGYGLEDPNVIVWNEEDLVKESINKLIQLK